MLLARRPPGGPGPAKGHAPAGHLLARSFAAGGPKTRVTGSRARVPPTAQPSPASAVQRVGAPYRAGPGSLGALSASSLYSIARFRQTVESSGLLVLVANARRVSAW